MFNFTKQTKKSPVNIITTVSVLNELQVKYSEKDEPSPLLQPLSPASAAKQVSTESLVAVTANENNAKLVLLAPTPTTIKESGLSASLLLDLVVKHLQIAGVYTLRELSEKLALTGSIVQILIEKAKTLAWIENRQSTNDGQMRYCLSHLGNLQADKAFMKNGYLGCAPLPLAEYIRVAKIQSSRAAPLSKPELDAAFEHLTFPEELIEKIGPALNSTKPILIYGKAGTGKSYFCRHLNLVFGDQVLIPYAIEVNNEIIQIFDPEVHHTSLQTDHRDSLKLNSRFDGRWQLCKRPLIITGGELTLDMLEISFDRNTKVYKAPIQLKANNGILLLDDLGRQKVSPKALFNRWIVPLEERRDFLSLQSGLHFEVPFELLMLFSTNLSPNELIDDAFLRRLGYKILFLGLDKQQFKDIWEQECRAQGLHCENEIFEHLINDFLIINDKDFLPCYPRDLLSIIRDQVVFKDLPEIVTKDLLNFAWQSYFV
ncbi:hypothetical protein [Psychromonas hadalis]|uniref:hypothetical protein n=1 Tax=Psychromonas hadalis TaxID=211669 RepID=UPI0003B3D1B5|nr:hypothetical protein [Psychromonas hadalis]